MTSWPPGTMADAAAATITHDAVPLSQRVTGAPATGSSVIGDVDGVEVGVWEMTPGAMSDTEIDEVFVVLSGSATVAFVEPVLPTLDLRPGVVVRLRAGMRTVWTVHETLRKVYLAS